MNLPVLYSFRRCPYAMRARLAIATSGIQCELREIVLRDKPAAMLQASPKGTVPVLIDTRGVVIDQSLDIMLWALQHNDPQGWLTPAGPGQSAGVASPAASTESLAVSTASLTSSEHSVLQVQLELVAQCDTTFKHHLDRYKYPQRYADAQAPEVQRQLALDWLRGLEMRLVREEWLFGPSPALADMAIAPFVRQFASVDADWFKAQAIPGVQRWLDAFLALPVFGQVMHKYPVWKAGDAGVLFPG